MLVKETQSRKIKTILLYLVIYTASDNGCGGNFKSFVDPEISIYSIQFMHKMNIFIILFCNINMFPRHTESNVIKPIVGHRRKCYYISYYTDCTATIKVTNGILYNDCSRSNNIIDSSHSIHRLTN